MTNRILVKKVIAKIAEKEVESFDFLEWAKKFVKIPTLEEAVEILKDVDAKELNEALKEVPSLKDKKSFTTGIKTKIMLLVAAAVLLGGSFSFFKNTDGEQLKKQIDQKVKVLEQKHPLKHKPLVKKNIPQEKGKDKVMDNTKATIEDSLGYVRLVVKGLEKNNEKELMETIKKDRDIFLKKYQELNNLKGEELKGAALRLRGNIHHYTSSVWFGLVDDLAKGKHFDDRDEKHFEQKDTENPEKMKWDPIATYYNWS